MKDNKKKDTTTISKILITCGIFVFLVGSCASIIAATYIFGENKKLSKSNSSYSTDNYNTLRPLIYPVGSIYISVTDDTVAKVEARYGGTWEVFGSGKTLVGVNSSDTDFSTVEKTGGSKSQDYTPAGSTSGFGVSGGDIPYTPAGSNSGAAVAFNAVSLPHSGGAVHNTTLTAAQTGLPSHTHGITKNFNFTVGGLNGSGISGIPNGVSGWRGPGGVGFERAEWTVISINSVAAANATSAHSHGFTQPSAHSFTPSTKSVTQPTFKGTAATLKHTHTVTQSTFTGTKATLSHLQPYVTVYMYKRTA